MAELPDRIAEQRKLIAEQIASDMETKGFAWKRPWKHAAMPHNPVTGTHYRGGNHVHLAAIAAIRGYNDPRWVTFNQAKQLGWKMRKGAKSAAIEKWKTYVVEIPLSDQEISDYELRASSSILAGRDPSDAPRSVHQNNLADCGDSISLLEQHNAEIAAYCGAFDVQCLDHALVAKIHRAAGNYLIKNGYRFAQGIQSPRNASLADKQAELAAIANNRFNAMRENPVQER